LDSSPLVWWVDRCGGWFEGRFWRFFNAAFWLVLEGAAEGFLAGWVDPAGLTVGVLGPAASGRCQHEGDPDYIKRRNCGGTPLRPRCSRTTLETGVDILGF
jgi:hypothetical protein